MTVPKQITENYPELDRCILSGYRGSIAHGMYVPPKNPNSIDDKDVMYIVVPPIDNYFGLKQYGSHGTKEIKKDEWDIVVYEALKFIGLLEQGNPNVLMMLWLEPNHYLKINNSGNYIIQNRRLFVGRHVYRSFTGYAYGQLHRMTHNACQGHMGDKRRQLVEKFGFDCYDAETTEFLTDAGWKYFDNINENDYLATINKKGCSEFQRATEKIDRIYTGMMYTIEPHSSRAIVTENHNLLVSPTHRNRKNNYSIKYDETNSNWQLASIRLILDGKRSQYHILKAPAPRLTEYLVDDYYLKLAGLYLSEGTTNYRNKKVKSIRFVQSKPGVFWKIADEVSERFHFKRYDYKNETQWVLHGDIARTINNDFGHSTSKHLPEWCFQLSFKQANILWESLMAGDGTKKEANDCYYTTLLKLASDIQACMILAGHSCTMYGPYYSRNNLIGQEDSVLETYQVVRSNISERFHNLNTSRILLNGQTPKNKKDGYPIKENYVTNRRVVCFTVPNSILITRNNGAVAIHGNCKNAAHLVRLLRMGIEFLKDGELQVQREDATQLLEIKNGEWSLEKIVAESDKLFATAEQAYLNSNLPNGVDKDKINLLATNVINMAMEEFGKF